MKKILFLFLSLFSVIAYANNWNEWVSELKEEAVAEGIDPDLFDRLFAALSAPDRTVQHLHHNATI